MTRRFEPVAVVDIGSNSGRVVVYRPDQAGRMRIVASARAALRLVSDVDETRRLGAATIERAMEALRDFRAVALGAGASRIKGVATGAMRDAENGPRLIARIQKELGFSVEVIDGLEEARYGFLGAVRGLPVESGLLFDLGGGSVQLSSFRDRKLEGATSLPLGALRLNHAFLVTDPPRDGEIRRLKKHVHRVLERAGVRPLQRGEELVGTGGTIRNLAKIDGQSRGYPITRVHGYALSRGRVGEIAALLASYPLGRRAKVPGLSAERSDSIVGGALAIETLMEVVDAPQVRVAGQGVREGVAHSLHADRLPSPEAARKASIASLTGRFSGWSAQAARRRTSIAAALARGLDPRARAEVREALLYAAAILDIGRSVDFFDRHEHVADIVMATELDGFSHRQIALLAAVVRNAGDGDVSVGPYRPLLKREDATAVERAAVLLALADDIEERCPRGARVALRCRVGRREAIVSVPALAGWRPRGIGPRFGRTFGRTLVVRPGGRIA